MNIAFAYRRDHYQPIVRAGASLQQRIDPLAGHPVRDHNELAARAVALLQARRAGRDVDTELDELISSWEASR